MTVAARVVFCAVAVCSVACQLYMYCYYTSTVSYCSIAAQAPLCVWCFVYLFALRVVDFLLEISLAA